VEGAIVGFGPYHRVYESGREGDWLVVGFSPRKQYIALYLTGGLRTVETERTALGMYTPGKGCLSMTSLGDVNSAVLMKMFVKAFKEGQRRTRPAMSESPAIDTQHIFCYTHS
jgi:hypothetical protein